MTSPEERELRELFLKVCERHGKKHGSWAVFTFPLEDTFLEMDTWNGSLLYKVGKPQHNYWTGFGGLVNLNLGLSDVVSKKGLRPYPPNVYRWFTKKIRTELERRAAL